MNLLLTMLIGGLWHGAAWTFVLWGAYHGILLVGHRMISGRGVESAGTHKDVRGAWRVVSILVTFHLVCFGWLIFRSASIAQFGSMMAALFADFRFTAVSAHWAWQILLFCWPLLTVQALQEISGETEVVLRLSTASRSFIYAAVTVMLITLGNFGGQEFIYFQF